MFQHVIKKNTGRIIEVCVQGSDTSRFDPSDYLVISDPAVHDPATECYDAQAGAFVPRSQAELLAEAKFVKQGELLATVNNFIAVKPDGTARYDTNLKLNLLQSSLKAALQGKSPPPQVNEVDAWMSAVQTAYFERKAALEAAADLAALKAVDISYQWFEARYGVSGSVHPDPDVYTKNLLGQS